MTFEQAPGAQLALVKVEPVQVVEVEILDPEPVGYGNMPAAARDFAHMVASMVVAQQEPARLSEAEQEREWPRAFAEWLETNPKTGAPRPENTRAAYAAAWEDFRLFCPKKYWRVQGLDVKAWVEDLRTRPIAAHVRKGLEANGRRRPGQVGLSDASVAQWLAGISAFYSYAEQYEVALPDGRVTPLFDGVNPAKSRVVKRPRTRAFQQTTYLDREQLRALLGAIRSYKARNAAKGLRDYALFLAYISTGGRNSEIRLWRWGDLKRRGSKVFYDWANKGKSGSDEVPSHAWDAIEEFLRVSGRLESMQDDDYIFTPLSDNVVRLKRPDGSPVVAEGSWTRNRPLSAQEVNRCLRQYARLAGLETSRLHVHCLRHSAYMLYREADVPLEERSRLLHHSSLQITSVYDHAVAGQRNVGWAKASTLLGL